MRRARGLRSTCDRGGIALPVALLALVLVSVIVAATYGAAVAFRRGAAAVPVEQRMLAAAERALEEEIAAWPMTRSDPAPGGLEIGAVDSIGRRAIDADTVSIAVTRLGADLFWLASDAQAPDDEALGGVRRRVGTLVRAGLGVAPVAALSVLRGAELATPSAPVVIDGMSSDSPSTCADALRSPPLPDAVAGLALPVGAYLAGGELATGVPAVRRIVTDTASGGTATPADREAARALAMVRPGGATWRALAARATVVVADGATRSPLPALDADGTCDTAASGNWGEPGGTGIAVAPCSRHAPVVHALGDLRIDGPARGQGVLLVNGNLVLDGDVALHGLVLVRDTLVLGAGTLVRGAVVSGAVSLGGVGTRGATVRWSPCALAAARRALAPSGVAGSWAQLY